MERGTALIVLGALLAILFVFAYRIAEPFLRPVLIAVILAIALDPPHRQVRRIIPGPTPAALVTTLLTFLLLLIPVLLIGFILAAELSDLYQELSQRSAEAGGLLPLLMQRVQRPLAQLGERFPGLQTIDLEAETLARLKQGIAWALGELRGLAGGITAVLGNMVVALVVLVFFLRDGRAIVERLLAALPLRPEHSERLARTVSESIAANVYGLLVIAIGQGILMGIGFAFLGLPSPAVWGVVAVMASLIPLIGTGLLWIPAAIILAVTGHYWKAGIMIVWGFGVVGMFDNFARPMLVGRSVNQHPLLLLFAMLGGAQAFGLIGLVLGPVVLAVTVATAAALREELAEWRANREPPPAPPQARG